MPGQLIVIKGAGDLATGVAHRLVRCGFSVAMLEIAQPTAIRRTVAFAETVYQGRCQVEDVTAELAATSEAVGEITGQGRVAVLVDPTWNSLRVLRPSAVVDAILAKRNQGTTVSEAPIVIGLGPGFNAGTDVHAVVETLRGHDLGRVIFSGRAAANTGIPGEVGGFGMERLLRSPAAGTFTGLRDIGDLVCVGEVVAKVDDFPVTARLAGVLRGMLRSGLRVAKDFKLGDIDPRCTSENCFTISDKARAVAGGVVEALLFLRGKAYGRNL